MANDRYRYDQDRYRDRNDASHGREREDDGYIARRGFGNDRSGYDRGRDSRQDYGQDDRYGRGRERDFGGGRDSGRERDFGDSAGYGSGGSALDWHDVVGDEGGRSVFGGDTRSRDRDRGSYGPDRGYGSGSSSFGRGSRDYNEDRGFFERAGDEVRSWFGDDEAERRRNRDNREAEHHRGRGPKGYQRSDERILEDVNDRLTDDPHIDASEIDVSVSGREVTLNGTVNSRFEKRHAEDLAESVSGVTHVQNNLRVQQYADAGMGGSMLSGAGSAGAGTTGTAGATSTAGTAGMGGSSGMGGTSGEASSTGTGGSSRRRGSTGT